jgi:Protein of unknown function (DUF3102)
MSILSNTITYKPTAPQPAPQLATPSIDPLDVIKIDLIECLRDIRKVEEEYIPRATRVGELLVQAKDELVARDGYGKWGAWLQENFKLTERTAQRYMQIYRTETETDEIDETETTETDTSDIVSEVNCQAEVNTGEGTDNKTDASTKTKKKKKKKQEPATLTVEAQGKKFVESLKTLKKNDRARAKQIAQNIIDQIEAADILLDDEDDEEDDD